MSQGTFLPQSTFSADTYGVYTAPKCNHTHPENSKTLAAMLLFGHMQILHTLIGMCSGVLAAAVPYPGKVTLVSHQVQCSTITNKQKLFFLNSFN